MFFLLCKIVLGTYIPGMNPTTYRKGEELSLFVSSLDSSSTQLPFSYYYLNFCPSGEKIFDVGTLGAALSGEETEKTLYKLAMQERIYCKTLCRAVHSKSHLEDFYWMIKNSYKVTWVLDSLPSGYRVAFPEDHIKYNLYQGGMPIGFKSGSDYYIYNHHHIIVKTYQVNEDEWTIVGFLVEPLSLASPQGNTCEYYDFQRLLQIQSTFTEKTATSGFIPKILNVQGKSDEILHDFTDFSYSVTFEPSNVKWASRWDVYLYMENADFHWLSMVNSFAMIILLSLLVAHILRKVVNQDIIKYMEKIDFYEENDSGWKLLRGDIFRPPGLIGVFSVVIGTGVQVTFMAVFTLLFACIGYVKPEKRGDLLTYVLFLFGIMGGLGGYSGTRVYKMLGGAHWKANSLAIAFIFPGFCFAVFFAVNALIWKENSSGAVDFASLFELLFIWFGISLPLVLCGSAFGHKTEKIVHICKTGKIPKLIPGANNRFFYFISGLSGSLPFGCMFIELNYIMQSMWNHTAIYYLFGFLLLCFVLVIIASAEVAILVVYLLINKEDYRWWWISVIVPGCSGFYLFAYAVFYYFYELNISRFSSSILYFGYMSILSIGFSLITGAAGFFASFIFIRSLYSRIKNE